MNRALKIFLVLCLTFVLSLGIFGTGVCSRGWGLQLGRPA